MATLSTAVAKAKPIRKTVNLKKIDEPIILVCESTRYDSALRWLVRHDLADKVLPLSLNPRIDTSVSAAVEFLKTRSEKIFIHHDRARKVALSFIKNGIHEFGFSGSPGYVVAHFDAQFLKRNKQRLINIYNSLEDDDSKVTFASIVSYRMTGDHAYLKTSRYIEYEHPIVKPHHGEWVIDCGAANGTTSFRFAKMVGFSGKCVAVEPDPRNVSIIKNRIENENITFNIDIENCAVSDAPGELLFSSGLGGSSQISSEGDIHVSVDTINNIAYRQNLKGIGTISIDIEGFEKQCLDGGLDFIKENRPKLQISTYHKPNDIMDLAEWVFDNLDNYALFMGHHETNHCETDYYAIPREYLAVA
jgi:FkbM family methyltransferase